MTTRVSVIIPTYNSVTYIVDAIESLVTQAIPDVEIVVSDDGSADDTSTVVQSRWPRRVKYVYEPHHGFPGRTRNIGFANATGEYVVFLDADDTLTPDSIERRLAV